MHKYKTLALLSLSVAALFACDKNGVQGITDPASGARVKFFNFGVTAPGVNFYANAVKMTAISATACQPPNDTTTVCRTTGNESTTGVVYPAAGNGALYVETPPGQVTLSGKIAATVDKDLAIANVAATLEDGKFYSYYISGIYDATAKKVDAFVVEDPVPPPTNDFSQAYVRLVNASSNSQPMTLFAKSTLTGNEVAIGTIVAYKAAGAFVAVPAGVYDLSTRTSGSTTNVATLAAASFVGGHVYTVAVRGDAVSTVTANKPALSNNANR